MKITETKNDNIKIVMSRKHAKALYNLLAKLEFDEYKKFTSEEGAFKLLDLYINIEATHI